MHCCVSSSILSSIKRGIIIDVVIIPRGIKELVYNNYIAAQTVCLLYFLIHSIQMCVSGLFVWTVPISTI